MSTKGNFGQRLASRLHKAPKRWLVIIIASFVLTIVAGFAITGYWVVDLREDIRKNNMAAIQSLSGYLAGEFNETEKTADVLAGLPWVSAMLESGKPKDIQRLNENLYHFNKEMQMSVSYILDRRGTAIASSNFREADSFVGRSYDFRKYFTQAMRGIPSKDMTLGITSKKMGLYASSPVRDGDKRVVGVAVVKQDLSDIEAIFRKYPLSFFVNRHGIILVAANPEFMLKSLWPLDPKIEQDLIASRQFGEKPFESLLKNEIVSGMEVEFQGVNHMVTREFVGQEGWSIVFLSSTKELRTVKIAGVAITVATLIVLGLAYLILISWIRMPERIARLHDPKHFDGGHD